MLLSNFYLKATKGGEKDKKKKGYNDCHNCTVFFKPWRSYIC